MSDLRFVKFEEYNDHEGETWVFFLQVNGNEFRLPELQALVLEVHPEGSEQWMRLDLDTQYPESEVDTLVRHSPIGYMPTFNKVTGLMKPVVRDELVERYGDEDPAEGWLELDGLYKGRVQSLFKDN